MKIVRLNEVSLLQIRLVLKLVEDFGGEGPVLHFAHANAYPIKSYTYFLNLLTDAFAIVGMNQRPMWAGESPDGFEDWGVLADDMIDELDQLGKGPVFGVGHSMGALATLIASHRRPDLFKKIVLVEPVILAEQVYGFMAKMSVEERTSMNPMMSRAARRRNTWETKDEAKKYFESKTFFQKFSSEARQDYLDYGVVANEAGGFELAYRREWESRIYGTAINPWPFLDGIKVPCLIVRAEHSDVVRSEEEWLAVQERAIGVTCKQFDGAGHMLPMEEPEGLQQLILDFLQRD